MGLPKGPNKPFLSPLFPDRSFAGDAAIILGGRPGPGWCCGDCCCLCCCCWCCCAANAKYGDGVESQNLLCFDKLVTVLKAWPHL